MKFCCIFLLGDAGILNWDIFFGKSFGIFRGDAGNSLTFFH
jgi:hypothetical protein